MQATVGERRVSIEIKTLNSKQLDLIVKLPAAYRSRELEVRALLGALDRGKVDFLLTEENGSATTAFNEELLRSRYAALQPLARETGAEAERLLASLVTAPDIWNSGTDAELTDAEWEGVRKAVQDAIEQTDRFRAEEGAVLEKDFKKHVDLIEQLLGQIPGYEAERIETAKDRIRRMMADAGVKDVDENRFEQELIYYLEKLDITEEKVRLQKHIDYFRQTMAEETVCGKKLGFVAQEMGREINTTGSKANHVEIQRTVVAMKDELEKIKEQLGNVL